jgi:Ca2+-binding RTX toxin-like protein
MNPTDGDDILTGDSFDNQIQGLGGNDLISGLGGNDALLGLDGNDTVRGGSGNDVLAGNRGRNVLVGGAGSDTFQLANNPNGIPNTDFDRIRDFVDGVDKISSVNFTGISIVQVSTGTLIIDPNIDDRVALLEGVDSSLIDINDFI